MWKSIRFILGVWKSTLLILGVMTPPLPTQNVDSKLVLALNAGKSRLRGWGTKRL